MNYSLSVPGKTFLCGEYVALQGGACLLLATEPRFRLKVTRGGRAPFPFHADSPAGMFYKKHLTAFEGFSFEFENPYGSGGFGGSTAEFLLLKAFHDLKATLQTESQLDLDLKSTLDDFRALHSDVNNPPSGADLVAQACGQITAFERRSGKIQVFSWPFPHLSWALFSTGRKLATHDHLRGLSLPPVEHLEEPVHRVWESLMRVSEGQFVIGLNEFARRLAEAKLQDPETLKITGEMQKITGVRVAKGCGAMGVDTVFVLFDVREVHLADILAKAKSMNLVYRASETNLSAGLTKDFRLEAEAVR